MRCAAVTPDVLDEGLLREIARRGGVRRTRRTPS